MTDKEAEELSGKFQMLLTLLMGIDERIEALQAEYQELDKERERVMQLLYDDDRDVTGHKW